MRDRPVARSIPTRDSTAEKDADKRRCLEWDSKRTILEFDKSKA